MEGGGVLLHLKWGLGRQMCLNVIVGSVCYDKKKKTLKGGGRHGPNVLPPGYATAFNIHKLCIEGVMQQN